MNAIGVERTYFWGHWSAYFDSLGLRATLEKEMVVSIVVYVFLSDSASSRVATLTVILSRPTYLLDVSITA